MFSAVETELGQTKLGDANHPWLPHSSTGSYGGTTETYQRATGPQVTGREDVTSSDTGYDQLIVGFASIHIHPSSAEIKHPESIPPLFGLNHFY